MVDLTGYKLTFDDEFNGFSRYTGEPQSGTWKTWYYFGNKDGGPGNWDARTSPTNGEAQYYVDPEYKGSTDHALGLNPFSTGNGALTITAERTTAAVKAALWGADYTSGIITTEPSFSQTYGYFEMRAKLPEGQGLWPAFWLLPADKSWPPELDVLEAFGSKPYQVHIGSITAGANGGSTGEGKWVSVDADTTNSFHTYGVKWAPDKLTYYFDNQPIGEWATPADMHKPMYMIANLAVGGNWPGYPDETTPLPGKLEIDYIRAYSNAATAKEVPLQPSLASPDAMQPTPAAAARSAPAQASPDLSLNPLLANGVLVGTAGNDAINMPYGTKGPAAGGAGNDLYLVGDEGARITENPGEGIDTVKVWADYRLPANVENLIVGATWGVYVRGNALSNIMVGGPGDDTLNGDAGDDVLTGGGGANLFVVSAGKGFDTITDFVAGAGRGDRILLDGYALKDFAQVKANMVQSGADVVLALGNGETLTFQNRAIADFDASDFVFNNITGSVTGGVTGGASTVVVNASGTPAGGVNAHFNLLIDGKKVGEATAGTTAKDFTFSTSVTADQAHLVQVQFDNDAYINGQDRNLTVNKVTINGKAVLPTASNVTYDKGALDGKDVIAGQSGLWWNGTLVVNADKSYFAGVATLPAPPPPPAPTPTPTPTAPSGSTVVVNASGTPAGGVNAHFNLLIDGKKVGEGTTSTTAQDFTFSTSATLGVGHKVQVQFDNDAYINGQDRNLTVNTVTINGKAVLPTASNVSYDKGALDGKDVIAGQSGLWWNGTLVVNADKSYFPAVKAAAAQIDAQEDAASFATLLHSAVHSGAVDTHPTMDTVAYTGVADIPPPMDTMDLADLLHAPLLG